MSACAVTDYIINKVYSSIRGIIPPHISEDIYSDLRAEASRIARETPADSVVCWKDARNFIVNKYSL